MERWKTWLTLVVQVAGATLLVLLLVAEALGLPLVGQLAACRDVLRLALFGS